MLHVVDQTEEFHSQAKPTAGQLYQRLLSEGKLVEAGQLDQEEINAEGKVAFLEKLGVGVSPHSHAHREGRATCN